MSLHVVIWVGTATQAEADKDATATQQEQPQEDVDEGGCPEGEQVERLVAIGIYICCVLVVIGLVNRVNPHITSDEPAEEEESSHRVPDGAESAEGVSGAVFGLLGTGQAGEHRQDQAKYSRHYQIDGNVVLPWTVIQVYCTD